MRIEICCCGGLVIGELARNVVPMDVKASARGIELPGNRIAAAIYSRGLTLAEFSKLSGISRGCLTSIVNNHYGASPKTLRRLYETLNRMPRIEIPSDFAA